MVFKVIFYTSCKKKFLHREVWCKVVSKDFECKDSKCQTSAPLNLPMKQTSMAVITTCRLIS